MTADGVELEVLSPDRMRATLDAAIIGAMADAFPVGRTSASNGHSHRIVSWLVENAGTRPQCPDMRLAAFSEHLHYYLDNMRERSIDAVGLWSLQGTAVAEPHRNFLTAYLPEFAARIRENLLRPQSGPVATDRPGYATAQSAAGALYLGDRMVQVRTHWGARIVVSTLNLDIAPVIIDTGWWEPWNDNLLSRLLQPGQTYVNVGASFGYFVLRGAHLVGPAGRVVAVEASPFMLVHLLQSIYRTGLAGRVRLHHCCAADAAGELAPMYFNPEFAGGGGLVHHPVHEGAHVRTWRNQGSIIALAEAVSFPSAFHESIVEDGLFRAGWRPGIVTYRSSTETLDHLIPDGTVDVLHMDIEGSEPLAILGGRGVVRRSRDLRIIMEWANRDDRPSDHAGKVAAALQFLDDEGFAVWRIVPPAADVYAGMPGLVRLTSSDLAAQPHCDLLLSRQHVSELGLAEVAD